MEPPLEVVTGHDGHLRDILDRPMIVVFDSTSNANKPTKEKAPNRGESFAWVDVSSSEKDKRKARKLARSHVMQDYVRRRKEHTARGKSHNAAQKTIGKLNQASSQETYFQFGMLLPPDPSGSLDPFAKFPIQMKPRTYELVHHCLQVLCPESKGEGLENSFTFAMMDAALFHLVLLASAINLDIHCGNPVSAEHIYHKLKAIQLVGKKLADPGSRLSDFTIQATSYLAVTESVLDDHETWRLHMQGLKQIVVVRGGLESLDLGTQQRIYKADFTGCVETDSRPLFPYISHSDLGPPAHDTSPILSSGIDSLLSVVDFDSQLVSIFYSMTSLNCRLASPREATALATHQEFDLVMSLRYRLLSCRSTKIPSTQSEIIGDACRIGALIYLRLICWNFPSFGQPYRILLEKLKTHLTRLYKNLERLPIALVELLLWLAFMGGLLEINAQARMWFVSKLDQASLALGLESWGDGKTALEKFWWVGRIHDSPSTSLWTQVMMIRDSQV